MLPVLGIIACGCFNYGFLLQRALRGNLRQINNGPSWLEAIRSFFQIPFSAVLNQNVSLFPGEKRWYSGESTCLLSMCPGFDFGQVPHVGWVCCWFSLAQRVFRWVLPFSSQILKKQNIQFEQEGRSTWKPAKTDVVSFLNTVNCVIYWSLLIVDELRPNQLSPHRNRERII